MSDKWIKWDEGEPLQDWANGQRAWVVMGSAVDRAWWCTSHNSFQNALGRKVPGVTHYMRYYAPEPPEPVYECPHCGNPKVSATHDSYASPLYYAKCYLCGAQGPTENARAAAMAHFEKKETDNEP